MADTKGGWLAAGLQMRASQVAKKQDLNLSQVEEMCKYAVVAHNQCDRFHLFPPVDLWRDLENWAGPWNWKEL